MKKSAFATRLGKLFLCLCLCLCVMVTAFAATGCDEKEAQAQRAKVQAAYNRAVEAGDTQTAADLAPLLDQADKTIADAKNDPVAVGAEEIGQSPLVQFVPEPFRSPVVLGLGLFAAIWRMIKWKNAAKTIAKSIEKLPEQVNDWSDPVVVATLDANQTPLAKAAVDLAQGKKVSLIDRVV